MKPNKGHFAIAQFEKREQLVGLITQNVDGLHSLAGVSDDKVVELHGTDRKITCLKCGKEYDAEEIFSTIIENFSPPFCESCHGMLKPATISFGQPMPVKEMQQAQEWTEKAEIFIVLGSSLQVQPAASFPAIAKRNGALLAIINRDETPLDQLADLVHHGSIGEFFEQFMNMV